MAFWFMILYKLKAFKVKTKSQCWKEWWLIMNLKKIYSIRNITTLMVTISFLWDSSSLHNNKDYGLLVCNSEHPSGGI